MALASQLFLGMLTVIVDSIPPSISRKFSCAILSVTCGEREGISGTNGSVAVGRKSSLVRRGYNNCPVLVLTTTCNLIPNRLGPQEEMNPFTFLAISSSSRVCPCRRDFGSEIN
jgi:hypothetical protein